MPTMKRKKCESPVFFSFISKNAENKLSKWEHLTSAFNK